MSADGAPLATVLAQILLPQKKEALLLRWVLGQNRHAACREWLAYVGDPDAEVASWPPGRRGVLPLMALAARDSNLPLRDRFAELLRAAAIHETFRSERWEALALEAAKLIEPRCRQALHLSGIASGQVYPRPGVRHHGLCIFAFATGDQCATARSALCEHGYTLLPRPVPGSVPGLRLRHRSGFVIFLQFGLLALPGGDRVLFERAYQTGNNWNGEAIRTTAACYGLLETLGRATYNFQRSNLDWLTDAHFLSRAMDTTAFGVFWHEADRLGLTRLAGHLIQFLQELDLESLAFSEPANSKHDGQRAESTLSFPEALMLWFSQRGPDARHGRRTLLKLAGHPFLWSVIKRAYLGDPQIRAWIRQNERPH